MTLLSAILAEVALGSFGAAIGAAMITIGASIGISRIGENALQAIARQPESSGDIRSTMIIAAALIEGAAFFSIIACILVIFIG